MKCLKLLFIRHAQSVGNVQKRLQGRGEFDRSKTRVLHFTGNMESKARDDKKVATRLTGFAVLQWIVHLVPDCRGGMAGGGAYSFADRERAIA